MKENRTIRYQIRFTETEMEKLKEGARKKGLTLAGYIRSKLK